MVPPLPESKANECAGILGNGVKCCGMEQNVVLCYAIECYRLFWKRMEPSLKQQNAIGRGGILWSSVQFCRFV